VSRVTVRCEHAGDNRHDHSERSLQTVMHLVVYDIEDDRVRSRIATILEGYGRRLQESVFECRLELRELEEMTVRLKRELQQPENGEIRIYRICSNCMDASFGIGEIKAFDTNACYII
jgi:CRISPR-associated protein Cas2